MQLGEAALLDGIADEMIDRQGTLCHNVANTESWYQRAAKPGRDDQGRSERAIQHTLGGEVGTLASHAANVNRDMIEAVSRTAKRRGLTIQGEEDVYSISATSLSEGLRIPIAHARGSDGIVTHVNCHMSILKLSPSFAFIPSAAATSYPECIIQCSQRGSLP